MIELDWFLPTGGDSRGHLEAAYWFGEGVLPLLRASGQIPELAAADAATSSLVFSFR